MNAEIDTPQVAAEPRVGRSTDPLDVLHEVLELQRESNPSLDVQEMLAHAVTHPNAEVVDSLGAVSVVCALQRLLTHENFTTLSGLTKVVRELDRKAGHR